MRCSDVSDVIIVTRRHVGGILSDVISTSCQISERGFHVNYLVTNEHDKLVENDWQILYISFLFIRLVRLYLIVPATKAFAFLQHGVIESLPIRFLFCVWCRQLPSEQLDSRCENRYVHLLHGDFVKLCLFWQCSS